MEKTFNATEAERRLYAAWEEAGAFRAGANAKPDADPFCILIPPPNVTGSLHMGHAFNNTLQDILTRWHRMRGYDTLWQPGQDHAGIATQMVVERELAANGEPGRREMGREAFIERVWQQKDKSGGTIIEQLKRLGASCDWSRNAFTMDPNFHEAVLRVFVDLYDKGLIYRGKRLVNWDPHFETAISDLEVEQVDVDGNMWRLRYPLADGETFEYVETDEDGSETLREIRGYLTVATTRPETMLGDTGVAVHPEDPRYTHLIGKEVVLPLTGRRIPIVADEYADPTKGTGAVKITPAHDFNDWDVGKRTGLRVINVMDTRAAMHLSDNEDFLFETDPQEIGRTIEMLHGQDRYEARDAIVTLARDEGWLDGIDSDRHMVPHGDRSKAAIEPFLTDQWFVDAEKIVQPAIDSVRNGDTRILPERDAKTYFHWLDNIEPWCISRQLWWGHQIPVWYGPSRQEDGTFRIDHVSDTNMERFCAMNDEEALHLAEAYYGRPVALARNKTEAYLGGLKKPSLGVSQIAIYRDPDVLDTWFSSGLWPIGTLGWPEKTPELEKYFPTSVLITGFDIIFFWVARMMMMQHAVVDQKPFDTVYVHALVRDEKGKKMSKSLGNVLDPLDLIDEFGADAVRFTLAAMAAMGRDLKLSKDRIAGYRNFGTKLWNAVRFAEMNGVFDPQNQRAPVDPATLSQTANRWILGETAKARESVDEALDNFRFNDAANTLYAFVWGKVCDWYVEFAKPLFASDDPQVVAETRATMALVLDRCLILLHPFMPFITEELWAITAPADGRDKMLVHGDWFADTAADLVDPRADREMNWAISLIEEIRSVRAQMHVPAGLKLPLLQLELDSAGRESYARSAPLIARLARVESLSEITAVPKGAVTLTVEGGTFCLPIADAIDVDAEKERLEKTLAKSDKDLRGLEGRLNNPKFVASAPEEVVEETRERLVQLQEDGAKLRAAIERLQELV